MKRIECPRCTDIGCKNVELKRMLKENKEFKGGIYKIECLNCYEKFEVIFDFENDNWEYIF